MGGVGVPPKDPKLRRRRNKPAVAAVLLEEATWRRRRRVLPPRMDGEPWDPRTRSMWRAIWQSPMALEFLDVDYFGLVLLAELDHQFWQRPTATLAAELRLQRSCYGLTPIDRRRLQWTVQRVEAGAQQPSREPRRRETTEDPRRMLFVLESEGETSA